MTSEPPSHSTRILPCLDVPPDGSTLNVNGPVKFPDSLSSLMKDDWLLAVHPHSPSLRRMITVTSPPATANFGFSEAVQVHGFRHTGGGPTRPVSWTRVFALASSWLHPLTL